MQPNNISSYFWSKKLAGEWFDEEHGQTNTNLGTSTATAGASTSQHSYATLLTFVKGALVGGNYDIYDASDVTAGDSDAIDSNTNNDGGVF